MPSCLDAVFEGPDEAGPRKVVAGDGGLNVRGRQESTPGVWRHIEPKRSPLCDQIIGERRHLTSLVRLALATDESHRLSHLRQGSEEVATGKGRPDADLAGD